MIASQVSDVKEAVDALEKEVGFCLQGYVPGTSLVPRHLQIPVDSLAEYLRHTLGLTSAGTQTDRQTDRHVTGTSLVPRPVDSLAEYLRYTLGLTSAGTQTDRQTHCS